MSHVNKITDMDGFFEVDPITRQLKNVSNAKITLMQYDHDSERLTFTAPRYIEGHDMAESTKAEVHFKTKSGKPGLYVMTDLHAIVTPEGEMVQCSWVISEDATVDIGVLSFCLRFSCVAEDGTIEYAWNTGIFTGISVSEGIYNAEAIAQRHADVLEQWKYELGTVGKLYNNAGVIFNDFENNKAISLHSSAAGQNTHAGMKGFRITKIDESNGETQWLYLSSTDGIENGDEVCVKGNFEYISYGIVNAVTETAIQLKLNKQYVNIKVPFEIIPEEEIIEKPWQNTLWIEAKPDIGDVDIGVGSFAEGIKNVARRVGSHTEGYSNQSIGFFSHTEGSNNIANYCAHAEGINTAALGEYAHAEGVGTKAIGRISHAEGNLTTASASHSHAEGIRTQALGENAHAEGCLTVASGHCSHAEGDGATASGSHSHAEGINAVASREGSHAEGDGTRASNADSHAEGYLTQASGVHSHAEGSKTVASGGDSHAEGTGSVASNTDSHAEGLNTTASGEHAHSEGSATQATGLDSHAECAQTAAKAFASHAEGYNTVAAGSCSHAEGEMTWANGASSHAEGHGNIASGMYSHAEGAGGSVASGFISHAEGYKTAASGEGSHAEGYGTVASGTYSHAEGHSNKAAGYASHVEGSRCEANNNYCHVEGIGNISKTQFQHVQGVYAEIDEEGKYAHIVGGGWADAGTRKTIHTVDWSGNAFYLGTVQCSAVLMKSPNGTKFKITVDDNGNLTTAKV